MVNRPICIFLKILVSNSYSLRYWGVRTSVYEFGGNIIQPIRAGNKSLRKHIHVFTLISPQISPEDSSWPAACLLIMACPPRGKKRMERRVLCSLMSWIFLRKRTISISQGPNTWDMLSSPHPSITPIALSLGWLQASSGRLLYLFPGWNP